MGFDRRMLGLLVVLALVGIPALALRLLCVGRACEEPVAVSADIPFCSLPESVRRPIEAGFREGRSPDLLAVTGKVTVAGGNTFERGRQPQWPASGGIDRRVPLLIASPGVDGEIPSGTELDDVAPTIATLMGIERPHPEVRSGSAIGDIGSGQPVPLVVEIVWKEVGSAELEANPEAWPALAELAEGAAFTLEARVPSLPLEPTAVLTTIGAGGTPAQHGITGSWVRTDEGRLVQAWSRNAPVSVIAALGDDLDELTNQEARIGLIADEVTDRGLIGANWYVETDTDVVEAGIPSDRVDDRVARLLGPSYGGSFGDDGVPDLLAITLKGSIAEMDRATREIVRTVRRFGAQTAVVVTATGSSLRKPDLVAADVAGHVDRSLDAVVVEGISPGGLHLDQQMLADLAIPEDRVLNALSEMEHGTEGPVFADVFPAIAVSFGRYC